MFLFPATAFGLLLMLAGIGCPIQMSRWEAEDRAAIAAGVRPAPGTTPDALRLSTLMWLGVLPLALGGALVARGYRQARNEHRYGDPNPDLRVRDADVLFDAGRQLPKVRFIMWLSAFCAVGATWWGVSLSQTLGLAPADGGVLQPLGVRLAVGGGLAALGLLFFAGMLFYGRQYVAEVRQGSQPGELIIRTVRLVGTRAMTVPADGVGMGRRHEGRAATVSPDAPFGGGITVHAPWRALRLPGRAFPLILDDQGWFAGARRGAPPADPPTSPW
jgi:hypothetical protein